jgi:thiol-disulfide isomerase/thioredoxin
MIIIWKKFFKKDAPWCSYCKSLAPTYEEFGKKYENNTDFVIAKIDASVNKLKDVKISYFPTIK